MRCRRCGDYYGPNDDLTAGVQAKDEDWQAAGGKCYLCFLRGMFDLYGGWLEPAFTVGVKTYLASGVVDASEEGGK